MIKNQPRNFKKRFSQNFLVNTSMQQKVVDSFEQLIDIYPQKKILEIGPGDGDLSQYLFKYGERFWMVELDQEKYQLLTQKDLNGANLIHDDAYKNLMDILKQAQNPVLVSNLPFAVGSRLLVDLAIINPSVPFGVILQKEVAKKCLTTSDLTFFGAWINLFWDTKILFDIKPGNFVPAPKVTSSFGTA